MLLRTLDPFGLEDKKMKKWMLAALLFATATLAGCTGGIAGCSDQDVQKLVIQIAEGEVERLFGAGVTSEVYMELEGIRTRDQGNGVIECAAALIMEAGDWRDRLEITYTGETTDTAGEIYVTVYGL